MRRRALSEPTTRAAAFRHRAGRSGLLTAIIAAHALGLLWLATRAPPASIPDQTTMNLIDVASGGPPSPPRAAPEPPVTQPDVVPPVVILPSPLLAPAPDTQVASAMSAPAGTGGSAQGGCALAQAVGQAILADPAAMAELEALPPEARSEADAVMLWDGRWQSPGAYSPVRPLTRPAVGSSGAMRFVIEQLVRVAAPECRDAPALGPQFIAIPGATRTTIVVVGSGAWRWSDLLRPDADCAGPGSTPACPPKPAQRPRMTASVN